MNNETRRILVYMPRPEQKKKLKELAEANGDSLSHYCGMVMGNFVDGIIDAERREQLEHQMKVKALKDAIGLL